MRYTIMKHACVHSVTTVGSHYTSDHYNTKWDITWSDLGPRFMESMTGYFSSNRRLRGLAVACWTTDHYHPFSNPGVGISEDCFVFHFVSLSSRSAHLAYLVHKGGHKTSNIISKRHEICHWPIIFFKIIWMHFHILEFHTNTEVIFMLKSSND